MRAAAGKTLIGVHFPENRIKTHNICG